MTNVDDFKNAMNAVIDQYTSINMQLNKTELDKYSNDKDYIELSIEANSMRRKLNIVQSILMELNENGCKSFLGRTHSVLLEEALATLKNK